MVDEKEVDKIKEEVEGKKETKNKVTKKKQEKSRTISDLPGVGPAELKN